MLICAGQSCWLFVSGSVTTTPLSMTLFFYSGFLICSAGVTAPPNTVIRLEQMAIPNTSIPKMNILVSLISTSTQHQSAQRQDRWHPKAYEGSLLLIACEPK